MRDAFRLLTRELKSVRPRPTFRLTLGPGTLAAVKLAVGMSDEKEAKDYLAHIQRLQVATYEVPGLDSLSGLRFPKELERHLMKQGWQVAVKVREKNEMAWVLYRGRGRSVHSMYIIGLEPDELTLVRIDGRLEKLLAQAIKEHRAKAKDFVGFD